MRLSLSLSLHQPTNECVHMLWQLMEKGEVCSDQPVVMNTIVKPADTEQCSVCPEDDDEVDLSVLEQLEASCW